MSLLRGAEYFSKGFDLISRKGLRRFVLIPLTVNILLFAGGFYWLYQQFDTWVGRFMLDLPSWLSWLDVVLWPIAIILTLGVFSLIFTSIANFIAAPFNGLLAERVELLLSGHTPDNGGMLDLMKDVPRMLGRELQKWQYFIPRAIGFFLLSWIIPGIGQVIWFLFISWVLAIQYCDYPFDNHRVSFLAMRQRLADKRSINFGFGMTAAVLSNIPFVNLLVMPVAVCGATVLFVNEYKVRHITAE